LKPGWLKFTYLKHFSQPAKDRPIYRLIDEGKIRSITELGLGGGPRTLRMLQVALRHHVPTQLRYAGFDLFESRPANQIGLTLKQAHRQLTATGIQFRLVPGELIQGVMRTANTLPRTDLVVISAEIDHCSLEPAWFYFPRMLHESSVVLLESGNVRPEFQKLSYEQVCELARRASATTRRAA
jgi:hypothetical protein